MQAVVSRNSPTVLSVVNDVTSLGGVEAFNYDLAAELPKLGIRFRVLNLKPERNDSRALPEWALDYPANRWLRGPFNRIHTYRIIQSVQPDWLLVHQPSALTFVMTIMPQGRWQVLSVVHNNSVRDEYWDTQLRWRNRVTGYVAVSRTIEERLTKEFGLESERVTTIPCGVRSATNLHGRRPLAPRIRSQLSLLYVGRLASYAKQIFDLVGMVRELNNARLPESFKVSLDIVGDGPDAEELRARITREEGRVEIHWHGRTSREELFSIYERTDVVLMLSSSEGMPIALREAMARGAVPVVTDIPAHREIVTDGQNGFLFAVGDVVECARACCALAFDNHYERISQNAVAWTRGHSVEAVAEKYSTLFTSISPSNLQVAARQTISS
jgi:glycosyltransferase involved in cell wall biosynthesis